jgi:leucyl/phenylalanyl-tRNA--protein transferase
MYALPADRLVFPHPKYANEEGLLAIGGDLSPQRLLLAYENGIFPWYSEGEPILWWSPHPRFVLQPQAVYRSKSMRKIMERQVFEFRANTAFDQVLQHCATVPRPGQDGTWLGPDMQNAYQTLHQLGHAHSVEAWQEGQLVGGLYGLALGRCFFGESMFALRPNASKAAFLHLCEVLTQQEFLLIDCQVYTDHLASLGATEIPIETFWQILAQNKAYIGKTPPPFPPSSRPS